MDFMVHNQLPETLRMLGTEIERVKEDLRTGSLPSEIANSLLALGFIQLLIVFREATGASLKDLKALDRWWSQQGVTDPLAFDSWAAEVFQKHGIIV